VRTEHPERIAVIPTDDRFDLAIRHDRYYGKNGRLPPRNP
jgi:hypothetical protein